MSDEGYFFQTELSLESNKRKQLKSGNKHGDPIRCPSKILAVIADPRDTKAIFIAESAGTVRRIVLDAPEKSNQRIYRGASAPLTSLALEPQASALFAGCWDKTIYSWDTVSGKERQRYAGHSDFVKAVVTARLRSDSNETGPASSVEVLISGAADSKIIVWNIGTGAKLHVLLGHSRGILDLAVDLSSCEPLLVPGSHEALRSIIVYSASSAPDIRRWRVSIDSASELGDPITVHETSVNKLRFCDNGEATAEDDPQATFSDVWTASSDNSAKRIVRQASKDASGPSHSVGTTLEHPDFVRDVAIDEDGGLVVTACRDEEVRVWDLANGELEHIWSGHYEEVTGLVLLPELENTTEGKKGRRMVVVSVSIDGTIRRWSLRKDDMNRAKEAAASPSEATDHSKSGQSEDAPTLTEDEERELAELMDDSDGS